MAIKTCTLQTCDDLFEVELKDMVVYDSLRGIMQTVSGNNLIDIRQDFSEIESKIEAIETLLKVKNEEEPYTQIETELEELRILITGVQNNNLDNQRDIENLKIFNSNTTDSVDAFLIEFDSLKKSFELTKSMFLQSLEDLKKSISDYKIELSNDIDLVKSDFNQKNSDVNDRIDTEKSSIDNQIISVKNDFNDKIDALKMDPTVDFETGGMSFKNINGKTTIRFNSSVNYGSDYGYLQYLDDDNEYAHWGDSAENSALVLGVVNDSVNSNSDVLVLKSSAATIIDSNYLLQKIGTNTYKDYAGMGTPDFNSGWFNVTQSGKTIKNTIGADSFFIGYQRFDSDTYMQFGIFSSYDDDDDRDQTSGMFLIIKGSSLIVSVYNKNNNVAGYIAGLSDGISTGLSLRTNIDFKIVGWKIPGGIR